MITRREFLSGAAAVSIAAGMGARAQTKKLNIGLELYSLRDDAKRDLPGTLAKARAMGFDHIETGADFYGRTAEEFRKLLDAAGLKATSLHFQYDQFAKSFDQIPSTLNTLGAKW